MYEKKFNNFEKKVKKGKKLEINPGLIPAKILNVARDRDSRDGFLIRTGIKPGSRSIILYISQRAKTCIFVNLEELFTDASLIRETAKFLVRANSRRFPMKEVAKTHPLKASCEVPAHLTRSQLKIRAGDVNFKFI